jgi:hypothetical protein
MTEVILVGTYGRNFWEMTLERLDEELKQQRENR